jgi:uncharacterized membrane protein
MQALIATVVLVVIVAPVVALALAASARRRLRGLELRLLVLENEARARARAAPTAAPPAPAPSAPSPAPVTAAATGAVGWGALERRLGGTWLNRVGAVVLTLGIGFFLKYAFDNHWIQPAGRVALGLVAGVALLLVGERLQRAAYRAPAQGVVAVGIATLYLSIYAAYGFYQLVSQPVAFVVMLLVTAAGLALALVHDARAVAALANLGGFLTPVLLAGDRDAGVALFTYLAVLDAGMLVSAYFRRWPELGLMSFVFTQGLYVAWFERWYAPVPGQKLVALSGAALFFLLFSLVAPVEAVSRRVASRLATIWTAPGLLALATPIAFFVAAREVLYPAQASWLAVLCLVLAAYYLALAGSTAEAPGLGAHLLIVHGAVALAFLTLTFPVQFTRHAVAIAWSVEGLAIVWGGFRLGALPLRLGGLAVFALAAASWLVLLEERTAHTGVVVLDHPAAPGTLALVAASALAAAVYRAEHGRVLRVERLAGPALALTAVLATTLFAHMELSHHAALGLPPATLSLVLALVWLAAGIVTLALAPSDPTRLLLYAASSVLAGVGLMRLLGDVERWQMARVSAATPLLNLRFAVGLLVTAVYAVYARMVDTLPFPAADARRSARAVATAAAALFLLWHLSAEVVLTPLEGVAPGEVSMAHHMALSILWTLYAFAAMGIGIQRRQSALRFGAIGLFAVTVAKVFLVDLDRLDAGYRILSFVVLGGLLILASFLYTRYRERIAGDGA